MGSSCPKSASKHHLPQGEGRVRGPRDPVPSERSRGRTLERPRDATVGRGHQCGSGGPSRALPCRCSPRGSVDQAVPAPGRVRGRPGGPQGAWLRAGHRGRKAGRRSGRVDRRPDLRRPDRRGLVGTGRGAPPAAAGRLERRDPGDAVVSSVRASVGGRCAGGSGIPPTRRGRSTAAGKAGWDRPTVRRLGRLG